jgi:hypothetical protein
MLYITKENTMTKKIRATYKILETINLNKIENYSITKNQWTWLYENKKLSKNFIEKFQIETYWSNIETIIKRQQEIKQKILFLQTELRKNDDKLKKIIKKIEKRFSL